MGQTTAFQSEEGFGSTETDAPESSKTLRLKNYLHEKRNAKHVSFDNTKFDVNQGKIIAEWLRQNEQITELKIGENTIEDEGFRHIAFCLAFNKNQSLKILNLTDNSTMGSTALASLSSCISLNKSLVQLNLSNTKLEKDGLKFLCPSFEKTESLKELDLSKNGFNDDSMKCVCVFLSKNRSVKTLNLNENYLGSNLAFLSNFLGTNNTIETIHLTKNNISFEETKLLAEALENNKSLKKLFLSMNNVSEEGSKFLGKSLESNETLEELDISYNSMKDEGAGYLINSIEKNKCLKILNLSGNFIGSIEAGKYCKHCLLNNRNLTNLNLSENTFKEDGLELMLEGLNQNKTLVALSLENNVHVINFELQQKIANCLQNNQMNK
eukprot:gene3321-5760_t